MYTDWGFRMSRYLSVVAAAAILSLLVVASPAVAGGPLATGHVSLEHEAANELLTVSFSVIDTGDFTASGQFQYNSRTHDAVIHAAVTCGFVEGNSVLFTAYTAATDTVWLYGARDNGAGNAAPPDQFGNLFFLNEPLKSLSCGQLAGVVANLGGVANVLDNVIGPPHMSDGGNVRVH